MRQGIGNHRRQIERPYYIWYFKRDGRRMCNAVSTSTLEFAKQDIAARFAKQHHKGERAEVWYHNKEMVFAAGG